MVFLVVKSQLQLGVRRNPLYFPSSVAAAFESFVGSLTSTEDCEWCVTLPYSSRKLALLLECSEPS